MADGVQGTHQGIGQPGLAPIKLGVDLDDQFAFLGPVVRVILHDAIDVSERIGCVTAIVLRRGTYRNRTEAEVHPQSERSAGKGWLWMRQRRKADTYRSLDM